MKKLLLVSMTMALLIFAGCSQKNPEADMTGKDGQTTEEVATADKKADDLSGMDANNMESTAQDTAASVEEKIADLEEEVNKIYFDFDKYNIRSDMQPIIEANAEILKSEEAQNFSIKIEGNCDEWGTDEYNYALGLKRAKSIKNALTSQGVDGERIMIVSYGESNPVCTESTKSCWDKNRRAEFKLLP